VALQGNAGKELRGQRKYRGSRAKAECSYKRPTEVSRIENTSSRRPALPVVVQHQVRVAHPYLEDPLTQDSPEANKYLAPPVHRVEFSGMITVYYY